MMDFRAISNAVEFNTYQMWFLALSEDKKELILEQMREYLNNYAENERKKEGPVQAQESTPKRLRRKRRSTR